MMRIIPACCIFILAVGALPEAFAFGYVAPEEIEAGVSECSGKNLNTLRCARGIERKALSSRGESVGRSGNTLRIRIEQKTVTLVDNPAENGDSFISYSYLGYSRELNSHILHVQYYEGSAYMVIHHHSGQQAFPSGFPLVSPDGAHFLSLSADMFAGYSPNNVEIWQVRSGKFLRVANYEPDWGPHGGRWASADHAQVEKQCYDISEANPAGLKSCGVANIRRSGSAWKLIE